MVEVRGRIQHVDADIDNRDVDIANLAVTCARLAREHLALIERATKAAAWEERVHEIARERDAALAEVERLRQDAHADQITIESAAQALSLDGYTGENSLGRKVAAVVAERDQLQQSMAALVRASGLATPAHLDALVGIMECGAKPPVDDPALVAERDTYKAKVDSLEAEVNEYRQAIMIALGFKAELTEKMSLTEIKRHAAIFMESHEIVAKERLRLREKVADLEKRERDEMKARLRAEGDLRSVEYILNGLSRATTQSHSALLAVQALFDRHAALEEEAARLRALVPGDGRPRVDRSPAAQDAIERVLSAVDRWEKSRADESLLPDARHELIDAARAWKRVTQPAAPTPVAKPARPYKPQVGDIVTYHWMTWRVTAVRDGSVDLRHTSDTMAYQMGVPPYAITPVRPTLAGQYVRDIDDLPNVPRGMVHEMRRTALDEIEVRVEWSAAEFKIHDGWYEPEELVVTVDPSPFAGEGDAS